jgi:Tol biopolymer transport system component
MSSRTFSVRARSLSWIAVQLVLCAMVVAAQPRTAAQQFQEAISLMETRGDYPGAIRLFEAAARGTDRRLAARSLLYIGLCYEKLQKEEATKAYQRILRDFSEQVEQVGQARDRLAALGARPASAGAMVVRRVSASVKLNPTDGISRDGRYVSTGDMETAGNLVLIDVATGKRRSLTNKASWFESSEYALSSAFSPDDKRIAYVWLAKTGFEIRLVGIDGSGQRALYRHDELDFIWSLEWAPDGKTLAAVLQRKDGTNQIALVSTGDGSARVLKTFDWRFPLKPAFSPDGRYIAYDFPPKEDSPNRDIFLLATDGSRETSLVQHSADDVLLGWAPDGTRLVFASDRSGTTDTWIIHVAGGRAAGPLELVRPNMERSWPMRLTTSGAFYYGVAIATNDVYVATLDATMSAVVKPPTEVAPRFIGANKWPEWSPDGKQIAYVTQVRPGLSEVGTLALTIQSLETGSQRQFVPQLRYYNRLRWAPDGRSILVNGQDRKGRGGVYSVDPQTGEATLIVSSGGTWWPRQTGWFPGGKAILYYGQKESDVTDPPIRWHEVGTGTEREVYRPGGDFAVSPDGRWLVVSGDDPQTKSPLLKLVSLADSRSRELMRGEGSESFNFGCGWAPDSRCVLCIKGSDTGKRELWRLSVDEGSPQRVLTMDNLWEARVHPDGRQIVFTGGDLKTELWVMENFLPALAAQAPVRGTAQLKK